MSWGSLKAKLVDRLANSRLNPFHVPEPVPGGALPFKWSTNNPEDFTWEDWEKRAQANYPLRFWLSKNVLPEIWRAHRVLWKTPLYWLRTHTVHRYHIIDMRYPKNGYKWGWIDRSEAVMFAAFATLVDFVENEYPGLVDWSYHQAEHDEFMALYRWWTKERAEEHAAYERFSDEVLHGWPDRQPKPDDRARMNEMSEALEAKDQEMLHRLVEVRRILWT